MSETIIHLELDCVTGEKIIFQRSEAPGALVQVSLDGKTVEVKPNSLLLAARAMVLAED